MTANVKSFPIGNMFVEKVKTKRSRVCIPYIHVAVYYVFSQLLACFVRTDEY